MCVCVCVCMCVCAEHEITIGHLTCMTCTNSSLMRQMSEPKYNVRVRVSTKYQNKFNFYVVLTYVRTLFSLYFTFCVCVCVCVCACVCVYVRVCV